MGENDVESQAAGGDLFVPQPAEIIEKENLVRLERNRDAILSACAPSELVLALAVQFPTLSPPQDPLQIVKSEGVTGAFIQTLLETCVQNIQVLHERMSSLDLLSQVEKIEGREKSSRDYLASLLVHSSFPENKLLIAFQVSSKEWFLDPLSDTSQDPTKYPSHSFIAGCLAFGADFIREEMLAEKPASMAELLWALGPLSNLAEDALAASLLLSSLLNYGAIYQASNAFYQKERRRKKSKVDDLSFAISYAQNIIAIVIESARLDEALPRRRTAQNRLIRLMLLTMAIQVLYRTAYGGMASEEFLSVIQGETSDILKSIKSILDRLVSLIQVDLPTELKVRKAMLARLGDYIDQKDSMEGVLRATLLLRQVLSTGDIDQNYRESQSG